MAKHFNDRIQDTLPGLEARGMVLLGTGEAHVMYADGVVEKWWTCGRDPQGRQWYERVQDFCWCPTSGMLRRRVVGGES